MLTGVMLQIFDQERWFTAEVILVPDFQASEPKSELWFWNSAASITSEQSEVNLGAISSGSARSN